VLEQNFGNPLQKEVIHNKSPNMNSDLKTNKKLNTEKHIYQTFNIDCF